MMPDSAEVGETPIETPSAGRTGWDSTPDEFGYASVESVDVSVVSSRRSIGL